MQMPLQKIPFSELKAHDDSTSFVWTSLTAEDFDQQPIKDWFKEIGFLPADAKILEMRKIGGNVKGFMGRSDILFLTTPTTFHPLVRLKVDGLKWTSDFVNNYCSDYGCAPMPSDNDDESDDE
jgi:hypothetical protein